MSGMTEGLLWVLCHAPTPPHPGPLPEGERETGAPLSCPPVLFVMPAGPPLSFPPVVSGNPVFFLFLYLCGPAWENHGFPINNVGNDSGGLTTSGMTEGD